VTMGVQEFCAPIVDVNKAGVERGFPEYVRGCTIDRPLIDAAHPLVSTAVTARHMRTVFESGIQDEGDALRQPSEIASFCAPVECAARQAVESALSTAERTRCNGLKK
jgi:hypothetical protein